MMRDTFATLALLPVLIPQALWVKFRAARLQEASGPRRGTTGSGPKLRILVLGDSSGAGVGVATQDQALAGRLAVHLGADFSVEWHLLAKCGATAKSIDPMLDALGNTPFDVAVIALGVNDAKNGVRVREWMQHYTALLDKLRQRQGVVRIYASGVPDLGRFPLLPKPLRLVLGRRAALFDQVLRQIVSEREGMRYVSLAFPDDPSLMASDGFHPGPKVYDEWALRVAALVQEDRDALPGR